MKKLNFYLILCLLFAFVGTIYAGAWDTTPTLGVSTDIPTALSDLVDDIAAAKRDAEGVTHVSLTLTDTTKGVIASHGSYDCTDLSSVLIDDFYLTGQSDHTGLADGDYFYLYMNIATVGLDLTSNSNIKGNIDTDFYGNASLVVPVKMRYLNGVWYAENLNNGMSDAYTSKIKLGADSAIFASGGTLSDAQSYNFTALVTGAGTITLQPEAQRMNFCIKDAEGTGVAIVIAPDTSGTADTTVLDGVAGTAGQTLTSDSTAGAIICFQAFADTADKWDATSDGHWSFVP